MEDANQDRIKFSGVQLVILEVIHVMAVEGHMMKKNVSIVKKIIMIYVNFVELRMLFHKL